MKYTHGLAAIIIALGAGAEARAQIPIAPLPGGPGGPGRPFSITYSSRRVTGALYLGGYGGPVGCYGPAFSPFGYGPNITSVGFFTQGPAPIVTPPIVVNNALPSVPPQGEMDLVNPIIIRPRQGAGAVRRPDMPEEGPLPGDPAGGFRPVLPQDRARAQQPAPDEEARVDPRKGQILPPPPLRVLKNELKPKDEYARQITQGRAAFLAQEPGRAAARFEEATRVLRNEPAAHFLLAQAYFALGKYREAVASIHTGLRLDAKWPGSDFRLSELYGPNGADYAEHRALLREALEQNPNDPVLLFLSAYQLWFDGRQDEARPLFRKAVPMVADPRFLQLFLDFIPGVRVVAR